MKHNQLTGRVARTSEGQATNGLFSVRAHVTQGRRGETQLGPVIDPVENAVSRANRLRRHRDR